MLNDETVASIYRKALRDAIIETDLERHLFLADCPYTIAQILDEEWLSGG